MGNYFAAPWNWGKKNVEIKRDLPHRETNATAEIRPMNVIASHDPYTLVQREMNDLFDEFFKSFGMSSNLPSLAERVFQTRAWTPKVDISETHSAYHITAELPGMTEDDVSVAVTKEALILSGEKKQESREEREGYHCVERSFGTFRRVFPLPNDVEVEKISAQFKRGLLKVDLPKCKLQCALKKVPIRHG